MSEVVESKQVGEYVVEVVPDDSGCSPREWDNLTTIVGFHRRYIIGDDEASKALGSSGDYSGWAEVRLAVADRFGPLVWGPEPLYMLDHSGVTVSLDPFNDPWDSGQVGLVFVTRADQEAAGTPDELLTEVARAEVQEYDHYLRGNVYGYRIVQVARCDKGEEHREVIEDCWGFIGDPEYALAEGVSAAETYAH